MVPPPFDFYRLSNHFLKFQDEYKKLEEGLTEEFTPAWLVEVKSDPTKCAEVMNRFHERLYDAYKLMRKNA